jgi:hypothetical protein
LLAALSQPVDEPGERSMATQQGSGVGFADADPICAAQIPVHADDTTTANVQVPAQPTGPIS